MFLFSQMVSIFIEVMCKFGLAPQNEINVFKPLSCSDLFVYTDRTYVVVLTVLICFYLSFEVPLFIRIVTIYWTSSQIGSNAYFDPY